MDVKQVAKNTVKTVISYLTYEAVKTVLAQLHQTDPPRAFWLHQFSSRDKIQDGEAYLEALFQERQDLAFRILTVREALATEIVEFLPEMVLTGVQQANMNLRRQQLERMTRLDLKTNPELDESNFSDGSSSAGSSSE
ncbi:RuBisCO chaperone RbcX [Lyngbya confervoides]|uniref:RuBisCO chaperone RbcX n=1 Tax=Lyngbya confervoides BDU141951 TaxID=1574623 RepID=A0ABD4T6T2_9CYAN|nr:chaperonin family protein RbcX [Lyngbya confervoides]MCM1984423.1 chaperonin family protein RbcX [Lyngbya confervoides BDU141951]